MNKHAYTDYKTGRTVTQSLPPGRFLGQNEILEKNDLGLDTHLPAYKTKCVGKLANAYDSGAPRYYRPWNVTAAPAANKTHTHVYQKTETVTEVIPEGRFLKEGETLLSGDLYLPSYGPSEPVIKCNVGTLVFCGESSWYRPESVKVNRQDCEESWRFLELGELIQDGDEACMGNGTFKPSRWAGDKVEGGLLPIRRKVSADKAVKSGYSGSGYRRTPGQ